MDHNHLFLAADDGGVGEDGIYRSALDIEAERMEAQLDEERRACGSPALPALSTQRWVASVHLHSLYPAPQKITRGIKPLL